MKSLTCSRASTWDTSSSLGKKLFDAHSVYCLTVPTSADPRLSGRHSLSVNYPDLRVNKGSSPILSLQVSFVPSLTRPPSPETSSRCTTSARRVGGRGLLLTVVQTEEPVEQDCAGGGGGEGFVGYVLPAVEAYHHVRDVPPIRPVVGEYRQRLSYARRAGTAPYPP